jgi:anti-sigma factor RsiW
MSHLGARLAAYVDGELPRGTRELVAAHLAVCHSCRAEVDAEARLKNGLTALGGPDPSAGLMSSLLDLAGPGGPPRPPTGPGPSSGSRPHQGLAPGHSPAPRGGPAGWAAFVPPRPAPPSVLRPAKRRSHLVAGMVSAAAVTIGAAFFGGDLSAEPQPAVTPTGDLFAARNASHTDRLHGSEPASILDMEMATGLPDTGFFQPVGASDSLSSSELGLAGMFAGSGAVLSRSTQSGFAGR